MPVSNPGPRIDRLNASVTGLEYLNKELVILRVTPDSPIADFKSGQYVTLGLYSSDADPATGMPKLIRRAFSIASPPQEKNYLEFCVAIVPGGQFTSLVNALALSDRIQVGNKIVGNFHLENQSHLARIAQESNLLMVATGTGIAPYMAMLRDPQTWISHSQITLLHGARYENELAYRTELQQIAQTHPNFRYVPCVSRETPSDPSIFHGRVSGALQQGVVQVNAASDYALLCGNPDMVKDFTQALEVQGFTACTKNQPAGNILTEHYW